MRKKASSIFIMFLVLLWFMVHEKAFALEKPAEFTGDLVITMTDAIIKAKLYVKGPYVHRVEMSAEAGGIIFIRPPKARGKIWMLDPVKKQYRILKWPQIHKDPVQAWTDIHNDMGGGPQGEEVLNGYRCTVYHFKYPGEDKIAFKTWFAEDLQFAIRQEADDRISVEMDANPVAIKGIFEVLNINAQKLDETLFEVPPDYKEVK